MSSETFWDGRKGSERLRERVEAHAGVSVAMGSDASQAALHKLGGMRRIGVITPYAPLGDAQVHRFFSDCGFEIVRLKGVKCESPVAIAHVCERVLRDAILEVNRPDVDAVIQVGTKLWRGLPAWPSSTSRSTPSTPRHLLVRAAAEQRCRQARRFWLAAVAVLVGSISRRCERDQAIRTRRRSPTAE
jgi:hypothetical protein